MTLRVVSLDAGGRAGVRWRSARRMPPWRRVLVAAAALVACVAGSTLISTAAFLRVPQPSGSFAVGKADALLTDQARPEPATASLTDHRQVRIVAWYPAEAGTGTPAAYLNDLDAISVGLVDSGEVGQFEAAGLRLVNDSARAGASIAATEPEFPVILLSPGNATNVEFYSSLAEELSSHGFVVVGIDHPYQVAAVRVEDAVAVYGGDPPLADAAEVIPSRIDERVADIGFVLDRLEVDGAGVSTLDGHLDLTRIGMVGHSNGGVAVAHACSDPRVDACVNLDGQSAGGPFGPRADPDTPTKPFMFVTKEIDLHPALSEVFEDGGDGMFRVVIPAAAHDEFTDTAMFRPRVLPVASTADDVITVARGFTLAFFDHTLRGARREVFGTVTAPTDVQVFVYPLVRPGF